MKPVLKTQLGQQLHLTPQLLQSIRLLQLTAQQLHLEVTQALELNPLLEIDEDLDASDSENDDAGESPEVMEALGESADDRNDRALDDFEVIHEPYQDESFSPTEDWSSPRAAVDSDDDPLQRLADPSAGSLREQVLAQLQPGLKGPAELAAAEWLVEQVDDSGYLATTLESLQAEAARLFGLTPTRIEALRQRMLHGEPCGYGAVDLRECLTVQLRELSADADRELALQLVADFLPHLASGENEQICAQLGIDAGALQRALRLILSLQPKPGEQQAEAPGHFIQPDVCAFRRNGQWQVALSAGTAPRLRVNAAYEQILSRGRAGEDHAQLRELLQEARWLSRGLAMRYDTLLRTAQVIVERQQAFLDQGEEAMLPMTLREIADAIGMHESTVSRITSGKYLQTPRGVFELKYFFSSRLDGAEVANTAVRAMVRRLIEAENPAMPLADDTIALMLARQGIRIARRTVAKYRDQLHIGAAKVRRLAAKAPGMMLARTG